MNTDLLQKYITGNATKTERQQVTEWIQQNNANMREYMAQRKLHDIALWRTSANLENEKPAKKRITLNIFWKEAAKIAAVIAIVLLGTYFVEKDLKKDVPLQTIHVPAGQRAELLLADGTKVWLNSRSTLTFPGDFKGNVRNVKLDGEGYFAVTKNTEQPFIVETNKCNVRVLGTEFNVTAYSSDKIWETSLLRGSVEIIQPGTQTKALRLKPNTRVILKDDEFTLSHILDMDYFQWREGLLCFNNISLKDMMEKLKLYYGVEIVVHNTKILQNHYTGKFRTKDGVEHVLNVLKLNNKFTYTKDDESNIITIY